VYVSLNDDNSDPVVFDKSYANTMSDLEIATDLIAEIGSRINSDMVTGYLRGFSIVEAVHRGFAAPVTASGMSFRVLGSASDHNAKTSSAQLIANTGDNEFHLMTLSFETVTLTGLPILATCSVGITGANYNDMIQLASLSSLLDGITTVTLDAGSKKIPANTDIKVKMVTQSSATAHYFRVAMMGHNGFV
jgi:hypothetical protein